MRTFIVVLLAFASLCCAAEDEKSLLDLEIEQTQLVV